MTTHNMFCFIGIFHLRKKSKNRSSCKKQMELCYLQLVKGNGDDDCFSFKGISTSLQFLVLTFHPLLDQKHIPADRGHSGQQQAQTMAESCRVKFARSWQNINATQHLEPLGGDLMSTMSSFLSPDESACTKCFLLL